MVSIRNLLGGVKSRRPTAIKFGATTTHEISAISDEEKHDVWYGEDDYNYITKREQMMVRLLKNGNFKESNQRTLRGLEHILTEAIIRERRAKSFSVVLQEQKRQKKQGSSDPDMISKLYFLTVRAASHVARSVGQQDAVEAGQAVKSRADPLKASSSHLSRTTDMLLADVPRPENSYEPKVGNCDPLSSASAHEPRKIRVQQLSGAKTQRASSMMHVFAPSPVADLPAVKTNDQQQRSSRSLGAIFTSWRGLASQKSIKNCALTRDIEFNPVCGPASADKSANAHGQDISRSSRKILPKWGSKRSKEKNPSKREISNRSQSCATVTEIQFNPSSCGNGNPSPGKRNPALRKQGSSSGAIALLASWSPTKSKKGQSRRNLASRTQSCATVMEIQFEPNGSPDAQPTSAEIAPSRQTRGMMPSWSSKRSKKAPVAFIPPIQEIVVDLHGNGESESGHSFEPATPVISTSKHNKGGSMRSVIRDWSRKRLSRNPSQRTSTSALPAMLEISFDPRTSEETESTASMSMSSRMENTGKKKSFRRAFRSWSSRRLTRFRQQKPKQHPMEELKSEGPTSLVEFPKEISFVPEEEEIKEWSSTRLLI